ncbi:hypothetical protein TB1_026742 [Malus domestica]
MMRFFEIRSIKFSTRLRLGLSENGTNTFEKKSSPRRKKWRLERRSKLRSLSLLSSLELRRALVLKSLEAGEWVMASGRIVEMVKDLGKRFAGRRWRRVSEEAVEDASHFREVMAASLCSL